MAEGKIEIPMLAVSRCGHDRGKVYAVVKELPDGYLLCNGTTRKLVDPKFKKKKHVQIILRLPEKTSQRLKKLFNDEELEHILAEYISSRKNEGEKNV